ncbi:hypothetical protein HYH03_014358 [Edaphochlamys debaryana]|uniref:LamG-like jellyroll fold domain-containing protein n=1 Tax=Edaphochlamys debaryana TaxID=47281 RepID=A0A836BS11_9CHLO|nr:hypothetical protein HYH03_014358 [Edaphochlamys debaryana]|eukprot:KAG2486986.1 hypothetical protein HYH03_014358 [Edaphochlamys debaryana]
MPGGAPATITGAGSHWPLTQGRFGSALSVPGGLANWAQVWPGPWRRNQPLTGFAFGLWFKPNSVTSGLGYLLTRQFNNADLSYGGTSLTCAVRNSSTWDSLWVPYTFKAGAWAHVLCSYDNTDRSLSLYVNGTRVGRSVISAFAADGLFTHGDGQPLGLGNIAGTTDNLGRFADASSFAGALDDAALWSRPLSAAEAAALAAAPQALRPSAGSVLTSALLLRPAGLRKARDVYAVAVNWTTSAGNPNTLLRVEISTDKGATWCRVSNGVPYTDDVYGGTALGTCFFPTVSVKVRVSWLAPATLKSLAVQLYGTAPAAPPRPPVAMGLNLDGPVYYSRLLPFADAWQAGGGSDWPLVRAGVDARGWPLALDPALDDPPGSSYWVAGRNKMLTETQGTHPAGTYTILINGSGTVDIGGDGGGATLTAPCRYLYNITRPGDWGIDVMMTRSLASAPINRIHVFMPGQVPAPVNGTAAGTVGLPPLTPALSLPPRSFFNRAFLSKLTAAGVKRLRFMDWGNTNGNNMARWADRNTPSSVSQVANRVRRIPISTVTCTAPSAAVAANASAFVLEPLRVYVTTAVPHGLVTGNMISIMGTNGRLRYSAGGVSYNASHNTPPYMTPMVLVTGPNSLAVSLASWETPQGASITACTPSSNGTIELQISPGVSYEVMISLANNIGADAWITVPHLADDDFVTRLATLTRDKLRGKLYLEYSNEVWNWIFTQTNYASRMAALEGATAGDRHLAWMARRSVRIFGIFDRVYGESVARQRVVRLIAVQQGSGEPQLAAAQALAGAGARVPVDALAIAPYFGANNDQVYPSHTTMTTDDILDLARYDMSTARRDVMRSTVQLARQYNMSVLAYEGGQHMGGAGGSCPPGCENVDAMQAKFIAANRDWRMAGLYDRYFRIWGAETGGAPFMAFSFISGFGKWGSWGSLEHMNDTEANSPKWAGMLPFFKGAPAAPPPSPQPAAGH